jgi:hypothetical protein
MSIEQEIKEQFAKFFRQEDYSIFKNSADFYFENAVKLLKKDIKYSDEHLALLRRNTLKRLYIGIGCELLLKAVYLKAGYCINKHNKSNRNLHKFTDDIEIDYFKLDDTLTFNELIQKLFTIEDFQELNKETKIKIDRGLRIAKVFRNKEGHIVVYWHHFNVENYRDIETSLKEIYRISFNENLDIRFAIERNDKATFNIKHL